MLFLLLLLPLFLLLYAQAQRRRRRLSADLGALGLLRNSAGKSLKRRRHLPMSFYMSGLALLLFALSRPQMPLSVPRLEGTVILAFDVSASMAADDLEPSRMEAAKAAALAFVQQQPRTVKIGVLAFSEGGLVVQSPTNEQPDLLEAVNRLSPQSGTSLGQGILAALNAILTDDVAPVRDEDEAASNPTAAVPTPLPSGSFDDAVIVLITDGENMTAPDPLEAAERAADYGVRVYTVGMGSVAGATLEIDGYTVSTRLDEAMLRNIADLTNGAYFAAESKDELVAIYDNVARQLTVDAETTEVTAIFAGMAILALLVGGALSLRWFGRLP